MKALVLTAYQFYNSKSLTQMYTDYFKSRGYNEVEEPTMINFDQNPIGNQMKGSPELHQEIIYKYDSKYITDSVLKFVPKQQDIFWTNNSDTRQPQTR